MKEVRATTQFKNNPHPLTGNWKNFMEYHVEGDCLLIWYDKENARSVKKVIMQVIFQRGI